MRKVQRRKPLVVPYVERVELRIGPRCRAHLSKVDRLRPRPACSKIESPATAPPPLHNQRVVARIHVRNNVRHRPIAWVHALRIHRQHKRLTILHAHGAGAALKLKHLGIVRRSDVDVGRIRQLPVEIQQIRRARHHACAYFALHRHAGLLDRGQPESAIEQHRRSCRSHRGWRRRHVRADIAKTLVRSHLRAICNRSR